jgi:putative NIF3 family GTP cyclohydrolase 1 type 2
MNLSQLSAALDQFFNVSAFVETDWQDFISEANRGSIQRFLRSGFDATWNGLMLENASADDDVDRVYLSVFPDQDILDTIIAREVERGATGAMIFTHHPFDYSERESTFIPISNAQLEELREHHISLYSCHAPLDCHPEISTANALADALGLEDQSRFANYYGGKAGIHGKVANSTTFQELAEQLAEVCELSTLRYDQIRHNAQPVHHIALVPGGGADPEIIQEALDLGADTFITGHWWLFGSSDYAANDRQERKTSFPPIPLNFLAASHYSTELIVMRDQMPDWFKQHNVETVLMRQEDPWA